MIMIRIILKGYWGILGQRISKMIFSEKSLSVRMSVCLSVPSVPSRPVPEKKLLKQKILLNKVVRYTSRVTKKYSESCCSAGRGEAELRIFNFKTTWSEFQKASQTAAERGEAELHILSFKTTWSELQKPSPNAATRGEAELRILNFKTTLSDFQMPHQTAAS